MISFTSSIRRQLLCWLLFPIIALIVIDTAFANIFGMEIANDAYDESLIDSANAIAEHLQADGASMSELPSTAVSFLKVSKNDLFFYQILNSRFDYIAGERTIPPPVKMLKRSVPYVRSGKIADVDVRIACVISRPEGMNGDFFIIQAAETTQSRRALIDKILLSVLIPQLVMLVIIALMIWYGVKKGLMPLRRLAEAVAKRSPTDLKELSEEGAPKEVKPLVESINSLLEQVRADREGQQRFVANAAHQLRTPLAGLKTQAQLALREDDPVEVHHSLEQIESSAERASRLVHQLLTLARFEPSRFQDLEVVDLEALAATATRELVPQAMAKSLDFGFEGSGEAVVVSGNAEALHEMMVNLIENAILYTPEAGKVTVRVQSKDGVSFLVEDTGCGIDESERGKVFERFYRGNITSTPATPGSGLGLAIVREIAQLHGAEVTLSGRDNESGVFVCVSFSALPASQKVEASALSS